MRILHTSDWHLGRTLHKTSLRAAQESAMDQIVAIAADHEVDLVVVSGDVFDHAVPSAEALELLEDTLSRLLGIAATVVTAGNHDSLRRLGYGSRLFNDRLFLRTRLEEIGQPLCFSDEYGPVHVYPVPYLHPDTARHVLAADEEVPGTHAGVMAAAMDRVNADRARNPEPVRTVVLAHAWVMGGGVTDSERDISVGGLGTVPADLFCGIDYVALGHLHRPQEISAPDQHTRLRYSGSPLRYSFSEAAQDKTVTIVELGPGGVTDVQEVGIVQPRAMANLRGLMAELLDPQEFAEHLDSWVSVAVTDDRRPSQMWPRIQQRFPHALLVRHEPAGGSIDARPGLRAAEEKPSEVAGDFVKFVTNGEIEAGEAQAFDRAVQDVREQESA